MTGGVAYIQRRDGLPATEGCFQAWKALTDRGWEIRPFDHIDDIDVVHDHPVIGGLGPVVAAFARLDVHLPDIDYPAALRPFLLDPDVTVRTMGWVRQHPEMWPVFVKPTTGRKEFTGTVVERTGDLLKLAGADDTLDVFVARPADLTGRTEWRAFLVDGAVRDVRPYAACPDDDAPPVVFIRMLAEQWYSRPAGCSIDVVRLGTRTRPDWRLVECNDGYALGSYGLARDTYAELLVKRWGQLTGAGNLWQ